MALMITEVCKILEDYKAEDITVIDVAGKSSITDTLVIATGRSRVHVGTLAEKIMEETSILKIRYKEGLDSCEWVVLDADVAIIHLMTHEKRDYYRLEDIWDVDA